MSLTSESVEYHSAALPGEESRPPAPTPPPPRPPERTPDEHRRRHRAPPPRHRRRRATSSRFGHLLRGEWIKFWSVRSTTWTLSIFLVAIVGLVVLISLAFVNVPSPEEGGPPEGTAGNPLDPFEHRRARSASSPLAVLGALTITSEYTHRHDPVQPDRRAQAAAGALVQGDRAGRLGVRRRARRGRARRGRCSGCSSTARTSRSTLTRPGDASGRWSAPPLYLATIALFVVRARRAHAPLGRGARHRPRARCSWPRSSSARSRGSRCSRRSRSCPGVAGQQFTQTTEQLEAAAASSRRRRRPDGVGRATACWSPGSSSSSALAAVLLKRRDA